MTTTEATPSLAGHWGAPGASSSGLVRYHIVVPEYRSEYGQVLKVSRQKIRRRVGAFSGAASAHPSPSSSFGSLPHLAPLRSLLCLRFPQCCGNLRELGSWDAAAAPALTWREGHRWELVLLLPHSPFEFKVRHAALHTRVEGLGRVVMSREELLKSRRRNLCQYPRRYRHNPGCRLLPCILRADSHGPWR
jgi:hypothetical protein